MTDDALDDLIALPYEGMAPEQAATLAVEIACGGLKTSLDKAWRGREKLLDRVKRLVAHIEKAGAREHKLRLKYKAEVPSLKKLVREQASALAERDRRIAELEADAIRPRARGVCNWPDGVCQCRDEGLP